MSHDIVIEPIVIDFETGVIPDIGEFTGKKRPPKTYKTEEAKANYAKRAAESEASDASLDIDLARIVCVGWKEPGMPAPAAMLAKNEQEEAKLLRALTKRLRARDGGPKTVIGHGVLEFDLMLYLRRCLYLNVPSIGIGVDRYRHPRVIDTMQELSFGGRKRFRSVDFYRRRFGIKVQDQYTGADIQQLLVMGDWTGIVAHCKADVETEYQIAVRLGFIDEPVVTAAADAASFFHDQPF